MDTDNHTRQTSPNHHNVVEDYNRRSCRSREYRYASVICYHDTEPGCLLEEGELG